MVVTYEKVEIDGIVVVKGNLTFNGNQIHFLIDEEDFAKVRQTNWFSTTGGKYIGRNITIDNSRKILYMHNFVMNRLDFPGKGAKESIDHINRNGLDNRKCNLRVVSQSLQNVNQKKKKRTAVLPEGIPDLPKHIWYIKAHGLHGDRFCVELKTEGITWKTTSSKKVSIEDKLKQALEKLEELYNLYPHLKPST